MKIAVDPFWDKNKQLFDHFDEVYLVGSMLKDQTTQYPQDFDLILVYKSDYNLSVMQACDVLRMCIFKYFGCEAHLTILSETESVETQLLKQVNSLRMK